MKRSIVTIAIFVVALIFSSEATAQKFSSLDKSPTDIASYPGNPRISNKVVKIIYSRPQLKGRSLSKLVPAGKIWRTGANEAVEVRFYKDVTFGGKPVKAGTYTMYTIPGDKEWTVIISKQLNVWGAFSYRQDQDVARVSGTVSKSDDFIEVFSMMFTDDMTLKMGWGNTIVSVPVK